MPRKSKRKPTGPVANCSHLIFGSDWEDLGEDRIRRWPSAVGGRRPLRVEVSSWQGISLGARHWYAKVNEAPNQWWSESNNAWVEVGTDGEKNGYSLSAEVFTEQEAISLALLFVEMVAGKDRAQHVIDWTGPGCPHWSVEKYEGVDYCEACGREVIKQKESGK